MKKNVIYNTIYKIIKIITQLYVISFASQKLGANGLGEYTLAMTYANYAIMLANLGSDRFASREIAYYRNNQKMVSEIFKNTMFIRIISFGFIGVIYYILFFVLHINDNYSIKICIIQIISYAFDISWLFIGLEDMSKVVIKNSIVQIISVILISLFVKNSGDTGRCTFIMVMGIALGNIILLKDIPQCIFQYKLKLKNLEYYIRNSVSMFIPNIAIQVYVSLDKILLGNVLGNYQLGLYEAACKLVDATALVQAAVVATTPTLAFLFANQNKDKFLQQSEKTFRMVNFLAFPMCFGMIGIAANFVPWYLGNDLMEVVKLMYLSAFFILTKCWSCVFGDQILMVSQNQKYYTYGVVAGAVLDIILNILLIYPFQVYGVLAASLMAEYVGMIIMMQAVKKKLGVSIKNLYKGSGKYLTLSICMSILIYLTGFKTPVSLLGTSVQIAIGVMFYFGMLFACHDENISQIKKILSGLWA